MINTKFDALLSLRPGCDFGFRSDGTIDWHEGNPQTVPTDAEISAEIVRLDNIHNSKQYQRQRAAEYPSIADQLDDLFHNGIDGWKSTIQAIKDKYPKP